MRLTSLIAAGLVVSTLLWPRISPAQCPQTSAFDRALCLTQLAISTGDPRYCDDLLSSNQRDFCKQVVGRDSGVPDCGPIEFQFSRSDCRVQADIGAREIAIFNDWVERQEAQLDLLEEQLEFDQTQAELLEQQLLEQQMASDLLEQQLELQQLQQETEELLQQQNEILEEALEAMNDDMEEGTPLNLQ